MYPLTWTSNGATPSANGSYLPEGPLETVGPVERPTGLKQEKRKRPPTGGGAVYLQTRPSHACVESKEEVDGVLGALGGARDPRCLRSRKAPCQGKTARSPLRQPQGTNTSREALIERVGICMTKQCRHAPRRARQRKKSATLPHSSPPPQRRLPVCYLKGLVRAHRGF